VMGVFMVGHETAPTFPRPSRAPDEGAPRRALHHGPDWRA
jgi:hypothetical protein